MLKRYLHDFARAPVSATILLMSYAASFLALFVGDAVMAMLWMLFAGQTLERRDRYLKGLDNELQSTFR